MFNAEDGDMGHASLIRNYVSEHFMRNNVSDISL